MCNIQEVRGGWRGQVGEEFIKKEDIWDDFWVSVLSNLVSGDANQMWNRISKDWQEVDLNMIKYLSRDVQQAGNRDTV